MYLKISADSYTFYDIDPEKGEMPDPEDIEVSDGDYVAFQSLITPDIVVQVIEPERQQPEKACLVTLKSSTKTSLICVCLTKMLSVLFFQAYLKFCQPIIGLTKQNTTSFLKRRTRASSSG